MTERLKGLIVTLVADIREDDVQPLMDAIGQLRYVIGVKGMVADPGDVINRRRIHSELSLKLWDALKED